MLYWTCCVSHQTVLLHMCLHSKKSRIRETSNLSTDADRRTDAILRGCVTFFNFFFFFLNTSLFLGLHAWPTLHTSSLTSDDPHQFFHAKNYMKRGHIGRYIDNIDRQIYRRTSRLYERIGQGPILWKHLFCAQALTYVLIVLIKLPYRVGKRFFCQSWKFGDRDFAEKLQKRDKS